MTDPLLKELDVTDFRSIRGHVHAPLDAQVVLVHGENGAGKTSLLSAIELALTGGVQSLRRADPAYATQLVHRSADVGSVSVTTAGDAPARYHAALSSQGITSASPLDSPRAAFFSERSYLPQALLGQLLQIYQESGGGAGSPLARFVGELLRLDRLDAIEAGLKPLGDVRNIRKIVGGWSDNELDKARVDVLVKDQKDSLARTAAEIGVQMALIWDAAASLDAPLGSDDRRLDDIEAALGSEEDERALASVADGRRRLAAIRREIDAAARARPAAASPADPAPGAFGLWEAEHGARHAGLRARIMALLPDMDLPADMAAFADEALRQLTMRGERAAVRSAKAKSDAERLEAAREEIEVARSRLKAIDAEMAEIPAASGGLAALLSELTSFVDGDMCPVCDRDYAQVAGGGLAEHVHAKVRRLSSSAQRLLELGRTRTEAQAQADRLDREIAALEQAALDARALAGLDREAADLSAARAELAGMTGTLREGARLRAAEVAARRAVTEAQSRSVALTAARQTLSDFARTIAAHPVAEGEDPAGAALRLQLLLDEESKRLEGRLAARRAGREAVARIRVLHALRDGIARDLAGNERALAGLSEAQRRAQRVRTQATRIRDAVDDIRSGIIRREFNERLNRLWRDLFVRLAPGEPFVPAFRIPDAGTQRIQPRLVTEHRDGGTPGGTPGAMLSAGNLNTAALTLFLALHLSVPETLPWLILDDPVQSMDDVHIAHLAALLRTLSKEHGRQVIVAVHDRQLFEYLRLELSPAFPTDSLLTLELARRPRQDTRCLARRFDYHEENSLVAA